MIYIIDFPNMMNIAESYIVILASIVMGAQGDGIASSEDWQRTTFKLPEISV